MCTPTSTICSDWQRFAADERIRAESNALFSMGLALAEAAGALADRADRDERDETPPAVSAPVRALVLELAGELLVDEPQTVTDRHDAERQRCASLDGAAYHRHFAELLELATSALIAITPAGPIENVRRMVQMRAAVHLLSTAADFARIDLDSEKPPVPFVLRSVGAGSTP